MRQDRVNDSDDLLDLRCSWLLDRPRLNRFHLTLDGLILVFELFGDLMKTASDELIALAFDQQTEDVEYFENLLGMLTCRGADFLRYHLGKRF